MCVLGHNQGEISHFPCSDLFPAAQAPVCPGCCLCRDPHGWRPCSLTHPGRRSLEAQGAGLACCTSCPATTLCCSSQSPETDGTTVRTSEPAGEFRPLTRNSVGKSEVLQNAEWFRVTLLRLGLHSLKKINEVWKVSGTYQVKSVEFIQ